MPLLNQKDAKKNIRLYKSVEVADKKEFSTSSTHQEQVNSEQFIDYSKKIVSEEEELSSEITVNKQKELESIDSSSIIDENSEDDSNTYDDEDTQDEQEVESLVANPKEVSAEENAEELKTDLQKFLTDFNNCVDDVNAQVQRFFADVDNKIIDLSLNLAEKISRHSMNENYYEILKNILSKNSNILCSIEVKIFIFVNDKYYDALFANMLRDGYDPKYILKTSSDLEVGDVRIEWQNGCIESMFVNIVNDVLKVLDETKER
ncbi:hypothetical protein GUI12_03935 [Anaplasmataceae bacterium AB001_6]|nr:hypothetical protein GUI12_03935 [Anaplasmataceae bacterium AB001_6]